jgi:HSP20 family protein
MTTQELTPKEKQELTEKEQMRPGRYYVPEVDIFEDEQALWLWADMPGVEQKHIDVELRDNILSLHGEVALADYEGLSPRYTEYNVGHYLRRFTLPDAASFDADKITARVANGVLELQLPKAERARSRRIPIATS